MSIAGCALACALFLAAACGGDHADRSSRRVILITCDTLRPDRLGVYGCPIATSPRLDAFAREAVVFDEAYSSAPWTGPALSSLLTGKLPDEIGVHGGNFSRLPSEAVTLAELARDAGRATAAVVSNSVLRRGDPSKGDVGVQQGFASYDDTMREKESNRETFERTAPETTAAAIAWLEKHERDGDGDFLLWVHYQDPHGPYAAPAEYAASVERPPMDEGDEPPLRLGGTDFGKGVIPAYQVVDGETRPGVYRQRYDAEIRYFDEHLGRLLDALRTRAWYDDALIVFTADHGESLGEHDYWFCHGENVHREQVHVPLVVRFPKGTRRPARVREIVGHLDLWPTILEELLVPHLRNRGLSLATARLPDNRILAQTLGRPTGRRRWLGVCDGSYRLVQQADSPARLFDVRDDPGEERDLAPSDPDRVRRMQAAYEAFVRSRASAVLPEAPVDLDPASREAMKRLGYTEAEER